MCVHVSRVIRVIRVVRVIRVISVISVIRVTLVLGSDGIDFWLIISYLWLRTVESR